MSAVEVRVAERTLQRIGDAANSLEALVSEAYDMTPAEWWECDLLDWLDDIEADARTVLQAAGEIRDALGTTRPTWTSRGSAEA